MDIIRRATREAEAQRHRGPKGSEANAPVPERLYRSLKLWSFRCDLEESFGGLEATCEVYERVMELRLVTPQMVLNYAEMLREHKYFERSFQV